MTPDPVLPRRDLDARPARAAAAATPVRAARVAPRAARAASAAVAALVATGALAGCGGFLESDRPAPVAYQPRAVEAPRLEPRVAADLVVLRPLARPGLETDAIAVRLPERRVDAYADSRWSAPVPDLVQSLLLDGLRAREGFERVTSDRGQFRGRYWLQAEVRDFQAEYAVAGEAPLVRVTLHADLGRAGERRALGSANGTGEVRAATNRLRDVVAAFEAAAGRAVEALGTQVHVLARDAESRATIPRTPSPEERR